MQQPWHKVDNMEDISSPALLIYPERVAENIRRMISIPGGDVARLRPHVKTHKLPQLVTLQTEQGITRFKCATIAEAEMLASAGVADVLLAYQPIGPNVRRLIELMREFPNAKFSSIVECGVAVYALSSDLIATYQEVVCFLD